MKNGYTPKQYAASVAIDALFAAAKENCAKTLSDLTEADRKALHVQLEKLVVKLANSNKLDISFFPQY